MWFQFPEGTTEISVQQMNFKPEFEDKFGGKYFRAPDHFAPIILALPKFKAVADMPEGAPEDAGVDFTLGGDNLTIRQLTADLGAARLENEQLNAALASFRAESEDLKLQNYNLKNDLEALKSPDEEGPAVKLGGGKK